MRSRISELWAIYWLAGGIVVMLGFHVQHRAREWAVIWRAVQHWFRGSIGGY